MHPLSSRTLRSAPAASSHATTSGKPVGVGSKRARASAKADSARLASEKNSAFSRASAPDRASALPRRRPASADQPPERLRHDLVLKEAALAGHVGRVVDTGVAPLAQESSRGACTPAGARSGFARCSSSMRTGSCSASSSIAIRHAASSGVSPVASMPGVHHTVRGRHGTPEAGTRTQWWPLHGASGTYGAQEARACAPYARRGVGTLWRYVHMSTQVERRWGLLQPLAALGRPRCAQSAGRTRGARTLGCGRVSFPCVRAAAASPTCCREHSASAPALTGHRGACGFA